MGESRQVLYPLANDQHLFLRTPSREAWADVFESRDCGEVFGVNTTYRNQCIKCSKGRRSIVEESGQRIRLADIRSVVRNRDHVTAVVRSGAPEGGEHAIRPDTKANAIECVKSNKSVFVVSLIEPIGFEGSMDMAVQPVVEAVEAKPTVVKSSSTVVDCDVTERQLKLGGSLGVTRG